MKRSIYLLKILLLALCMIRMTGCNKPFKNISSYVIMKIPELHNGDAKFSHDRVFTQVNGTLMCIDFSGEITNRYEETYVHWIDVLETDDKFIIVYGNWDKEIGLIQLDSEYNMISDNVLMTMDNLCIDPTLTKTGEDYYLTCTEIIGTVNNADPNTVNGNYKLHLYMSEDLAEWSWVSDIADLNYNIEDVDIVDYNNVKYVFYEQEVVDKGCSSIIVKQSLDKGVTWSEPTELLAPDCDHEPASVEISDNEVIVYYSSDKDNPGSSYMGAKAYYAVFDNNFQCMESDIAIETETESGILLYDIVRIEGRRFFVFAKDYLTSCDLVLEAENLK